MPTPERHPQPWRARWQELHGDYALARTTTVVDGRPVRSLSAGEVRGLPEVVFVPGLGAPGYIAPWARAASAWTRATVLDLPGWHHGRARACEPTVHGLAAGIVRWLEASGKRDVILLGHSTGAQGVLRAALLAPERLAGVVLAGPTFVPSSRTVPSLVARALTTLPREAGGELPAAVPSYVSSGGVPLLRLLLDAMADRPEDAAPELRALGIPTLVTTGWRDGFAPAAWSRHLAELAGARAVVLPGAHNACFPYPREADAALREAAEDWFGPA
ncbi:alpha/beta fold hydrolase [Georgenia sp. MJ206]|uniref:alpha/beta fold hydrolase n=1 Tax=Georgenia wangjunii TaxID=3117730 RepID=UPI002F26B4B9